MPTLYARFFNNGATLYAKAKEVAGSKNFSITVDDPANGILHMHKKVQGKTIHLAIYVGSGKDRGVTIEIKPGDEGWYMDYGRQFIDNLKKVVR